MRGSSVSRHGKAMAVGLAAAAGERRKTTASKPASRMAAKSRSGKDCPNLTLRGQLSLELLVDVLIVLALIGVALGALQPVQERARQQQQLQMSRVEVEAQARAMDELGVFPHAFMDVDRAYKADRHRLEMEEGGRIVEARTLHGGTDGNEPV